MIGLPYWGKFVKYSVVGLWWSIKTIGEIYGIWWGIYVGYIGLVSCFVMCEYKYSVLC